MPLLLTTGLALASLATSLVTFQLLFGVVVGVSAAAIFAPMMACVTGWFDTRRSLAVSLVSAGMGMAPMTMSPLVAWLVQSHDWRTTLQIIAGLVAVIMVPVALLVRRPPALAHAARPRHRARRRSPALSVGQALRSAPFLILVADQLPELRHPLRADLSHGELRRHLRHSADGRGVDLQPRRACGHGRPPGVRVAG